MAAEDCSKVAIEAGLKKVKVMLRTRKRTWVCYPSLHNGGIEVTEIIDVTMPHNGCRPQRRRV
jgi:small subunit ribosomal protein S11